MSFNESVITEFRANGGVVGGELAEMSLLLLTTRDPSGGRRTTPLAYHRRGDRYLVTATNGGARRNPAWFGNLERDPDVTVEIGVEAFAAKARILEGAERDTAFGAIVAVAPSAGMFEARAGRTIPVIELNLIGEEPRKRRDPDDRSENQNPRDRDHGEA
jgi:deazaflavin-dependent oxidoreductase (nitroreductase family)